MVKGNFGQLERFRFNIDQFVRDRKQAILRHIESFNVPLSYVLRDSESPLPPAPPAEPAPSMPDEPPSSESPPPALPPQDLTHTVAELISSYLVYHGYADTAKAFELQRAESRDSYAAGLDIDDDSVMGFVNGFDSREMEPVDDHGMTARQRINAAILAGQAQEALQLVREHFPAAVSTDRIEFGLRCQEFVELVKALARRAGKKSADTNAMEVDEVEDDARLHVLECGRRLQADFGGEPSIELSGALIRIFGLLAYTDPAVECPDLASQAARERLAEGVNSVILSRPISTRRCPRC